MCVIDCGSKGVAHAVSGEAATLIRLNEAAAASTDATQALAMQAAKVAFFLFFF
jgi:hypothetical protein